MDLETSGFFVLRTPACPVQDWLDADASTPGGPEAWAAARERSRDRLRRLLARADVEEAIFVASPSLHAGVAEWRRDSDGERGQKVERALVRYVARMAGRATPFGLFAGWSLGKLGATTTLTLGDRDRDRRHSRLDNDLLAELTATLAGDPAIRARLHLAPNDTIYRIGRQLRFVTRRFAGGARVLDLAAIDADDHVVAALRRTAAEPTVEALAAAIAADEGVTPAEARAFVDELIDEQLLVTDLELPVTGSSPLAAVIAALPPDASARERLASVEAELARLDAAPLGLPVTRYRSLAERLEPLAPAPSRVLQIDLQRQADTLTLGAEPLAELARAVELLRRIAPRRHRDPLAAFRAAFNERYGLTEVPLAEALDEEAGIGFEPADNPALDSSPLLDGVRFPSRAEEERRFTDWDGLLLRRIASAEGELVLDDDDIAALSHPDPPPLPDAFAVRATLDAASSAAVDAGDYRWYVHGADGPSGANLLGRFCAVDPTLTAAIGRHLRAEEAHRPDAIFAEIVHLPEGRLANLIVRPSLRTHEIRLLGRSGLPREGQIALDDLRISVNRDRVVLRSARLGCEIIPRLSTAHNFTTRRSLGIYRFLCALQRQDSAAATLSWGPLQHAPKLPRIRHGRIILSLARWRLEARQLEPLGRGDGAARFAAVQALRAQLALPRRASLVESDHVLPLDLDDPLDVESFVTLVQRGERADLVETFPAPDRLCVESPAGRFTHELLVPMHRPPRPALPASTPRPSSTLRRSFIAGSEWLSFKIYPADDLERLLCDDLAPIIGDLLARGAADRWFFLRYRDPAPHLRLRFGGVPGRLTGEVLPRLHAVLDPLVRDERVWRVQLGTYGRELERYGGDDGMLACEALFFADSEAALALLRRPHDPEQRWQWTLRGADLLLDALDLDLASRLSIMERVYELFFREFEGDVLLQRTIGARHRALRDKLDAVFTSGIDPAAEAVLARRAERIAMLRARPEWPPTSVRMSVASSLVHMHANRMLRGNARAQELVLYDFLTRRYRSLLKRR